MMKNNEIDLSVIIVCFRGLERLTRCLEALDSFSGLSFSMEVIIVNNNPGDNIFSTIEKKFPDFIYISNIVNGGYSNGCNLGAAKARGNRLLLLNPDTVVTEGAIKNLLTFSGNEPSAYIVSCRQVRENGEENKAYGHFPWKRTKTDERGDEQKIKDRNDCDKIIFPDWVSGSVMMIMKEHYELLQGFDEDFWMYYEDVDICFRARKLGGRIAFINDITVEHNHGGSTREDLRITSLAKCEVQISRHLYVHKHETGIRRILIQIIIAADNLIPGLLSAAAGLVFFFIPELFVRFLVYVNMVRYYFQVLLRQSWISPRSVNYSM